jgi:hypothetical protein
MEEALTEAHSPQGIEANDDSRQRQQDEQHQVSGEVVVE